MSADYSFVHSVSKNNTFGPLANVDRISKFCHWQICKETVYITIAVFYLTLIVLSHCSVLFFSSTWSEGWPHVGHTMDVLSPFISVLCQAVRGLPRLREPALFLALSLSPRNSLVSLWCDHSLTVSDSPLFTPALLRTQSFVLFVVHETRRIFLSPFISKASRSVSSFFLSVQLSQPYVATGHTSAFISRIFVEIGMLWLSIFFAVMPRSPKPCITSYGIPSSVVRHPRYGKVSTCSSCSFGMSMQHAVPSLAITLVLSTLMNSRYLQLIRSGRSTGCCSSTSKVANRMM